MTIIRTRTGHELLEFIPGGDVPLPPDPGIPMTFTMVVATYHEKLVLFYNRNRQQWETPGGGIEPGETPYDCALRELQEESCQIAARMVYKGLLKLKFQPRGQLEYAALYRAEIDTEQPFVPNNEALYLTYWNLQDALEGAFDIPFTRKLIELAGVL